MTKIRNSKPKNNRGLESKFVKLVLAIGYWNLKFICYLVLVFWNFLKPINQTSAIRNTHQP
jgi:hypothetical protein